MSDLQAKFGNGMNKLQEGIEQGKMKLQVAQEVAQLKKITQEKLQAKTEILLELGQTTYMQLRNDEVRIEVLKGIVEPVQELDIAIYNMRKQIANLQNQGQKGQCSCGGSLSLNDKFVDSAGKKMSYSFKQTMLKINHVLHVVNKSQQKLYSVQFVV